MSAVLGAGEFILAFMVFLLAHRIPTIPVVRSTCVATLGPRGFTLAYSALSLLLLAWVIGAAGRAPYVHLWDTVPALAYFALALMLAAFLIASLALGRPNPFSFGGMNNGQFDPARPGIVRLTRHPLLVALALWSLAHLVVKGNAAHLLMFGSFLAFSFLGMRMLNRRKQRQMGGNWQDLDSAVAARPLLACLLPLRETVLRGCVAVALLYLMLLLHPVLFGVDPLHAYFLG
ncbi:NnrU family protein [Pannonibacter phragmitetus]|uniref:NnrU family protein n=1 Tax=Pannonibacter phragmitetus TaxID=121719 RepID=UPI00067E11CD|nr:NnrU family protein [Pannonibacter phragmitetus]KND19000.1 NnrU family protein [Pannonibacter phragmitetus]